MKKTSLTLVGALITLALGCSCSDNKETPEPTVNDFSMGGTTVSVSPTGDIFTGTSTVYTFNFDTETHQATIDLAGAQFMDRMPALNMTFPGIDYVETDGTYILSGESIIPEIGGVPNPSYPVSNLSARVTPGVEATLSFGCTPPRLGLFSVTATLTDK